MIDFRKPDSQMLRDYRQAILQQNVSCEYSPVNLAIWGKQRMAYFNGYWVFFSQFDRRAVYPFPVGKGDIKPVLDALLQDAQQRGIRCCITAMSPEQCELLNALYPDKFCIFADRDGFDYLYNIDDLADLKGRRYQKKRNHVNKFQSLFPSWRTEEFSAGNIADVQQFLQQWYDRRLQDNPMADFHLEQLALEHALRDWKELGLEGLVLRDDQRVLAFSLASLLNKDTADVHFEKAAEDADGAYAAINQAMASWLRQRHPAVRYLNREDDMGIEGLRKAKLSYDPVHMNEKYWAKPRGDEDDC